MEGLHTPPPSPKRSTLVSKNLKTKIKIENIKFEYSGNCVCRGVSSRGSYALMNKIRGVYFPEEIINSILCP